jgi:hypothetical protein
MRNHRKLLTNVALVAVAIGGLVGIQMITESDWDSNVQAATFCGAGFVQGTCAPAGQVVTHVGVKSGQSCFVTSSDGPVPGRDGTNCYNVSGIGTQCVTVTGGGTSSGCQGISHIEIRFGPGASPEPSPEPSPSPTP